jgi:hypothetical protein
MRLRLNPRASHRAVTAGVANHVWTIADLVAMMERLEERGNNHD